MPLHSIENRRSLSYGLAHVGQPILSETVRARRLSSRLNSVTSFC